MTTQRSNTNTTAQAGRNIFEMEGDAESLERQRKMSQIRESTIYCDEGTAIGGDGTAPSPMEYFLSSLLF